MRRRARGRARGRHLRLAAAEPVRRRAGAGAGGRRSAELERSHPRAVLFRAEGRVVSGGVDVELFAALDGREAAARTVRRPGDDRPPRRRAPLPDGVRRARAVPDLGLRAGAGLRSDPRRRVGKLRPWSRSVIGLTPAMGGTQRLAERAGTGRARELVMTGDRYDAATMERWNVVNRVYPDDGFDAAGPEVRRPARGRADARSRGDQAGDPGLPRGRRRAG